MIYLFLIIVVQSLIFSLWKVIHRCSLSRVPEFGPCHCGNRGWFFLVNYFCQFLQKNVCFWVQSVIVFTPAFLFLQLCSKQEDWRRMGEVFKSNCPSSQHLTHMEKISGRIAIALLSESKDKLSLPFGTFAETGTNRLCNITFVMTNSPCWFLMIWLFLFLVCQNEGEDSLVKSFLGRIGVSLMLRYHKTHQWAKVNKLMFTSDLCHGPLEPSWVLEMMHSYSTTLMLLFLGLSWLKWA